MNLNLAVIVGRLTRDPELKNLPGGTAVTSISVATNSSYKNSKGEKIESTEFHNIVVFGNTAETCAKYLVCGQEVVVRGRIQTRSWDDKNSGEKRYRTEIVAEAVQFGSKPHYGGAEASVSSKNASASSAAPAKVKSSVEPAKTASTKGFEYPTDDINPDDIPF